MSVTNMCKQIIMISHGKFKKSRKLKVPQELISGSNQLLWVGQGRPHFSNTVALLIHVLKRKLHTITSHRGGSEL